MPNPQGREFMTRVPRKLIGLRQVEADGKIKTETLCVIKSQLIYHLQKEK
jgi:hypothetical protein